MCCLSRRSRLLGRHGRTRYLIMPDLSDKPAMKAQTTCANGETRRHAPALSYERSQTMRPPRRSAKPRVGLLGDPDQASVVVVELAAGMHGPNRAIVGSGLLVRNAGLRDPIRQHPNAPRLPRHSASADEDMDMELHSVQVSLLRAIWRPVAEPQHNAQPVWPVWDYVARVVRKEHPEVDDVFEVFASLPTWTVPVDGGTGRRYGLVWYDGDMGGRPQLTSKVGLTIAGLHALGAHPYLSVADAADHYAALVGAIARADDQLDPNPNEPAASRVKLETLASTLDSATPQIPTPLPDDISVAILQREAAILEITGQPGQPATVLLGRGWSRRFRHVRTSRDYISMVESLRAEWTAQPHASPLSLVQTFDYLGLVLAAHPAWEGKRFTEAPDLESAALLGCNVRNADEYKTALNGLWTVIDGLNVPSIPKEERTVNQNGSIARLEYWLDKHVVPQVGNERIAEAARTLRDARLIRTADVHPDADNQQRAAGARRRLGLPEFTVDYGLVWETMRVRVAGALDLVRQEVRAAQRAVETGS